MPEFERLVQQHGKFSVLFDMTGFHGWDAGELWEDTKFAIKHFADIERLAMGRGKEVAAGHGDVLQAVYESDDPILRSRQGR